MKATILIVDDEPAARHGLRRALEGEETAIIEAADGTEALEQIRQADPDVIVCDIQMPGMNGLHVLEHVVSMPAPPPFIVMTAFGSERIAVDAMKAGAYDYISKPYEVDEIRRIIENARETVRLRRENQALRSELSQRAGFGSITGSSEPMQEVYSLIGKVAATDATVLIGGESGTGKELVARTIHNQSNRAERPFVAMSAAALPTELIESELFGHEKGAFTGASSRKPGKFEMADGGSLFLDEIGDMGLETQAKLLRVLQERVFERLGGTESITADVRLISATNKLLPEEIGAGRFREDLYYRLKVVDITLPPLRQRREDIPTLIQHFLDRYNAQHDKRVADVEPTAMRLMVDHSWPGNVRQLMNTVERAVILSEGPTLTPGLLADEIRTPIGDTPATSIQASTDATFQQAKADSVRSFETAYITRALSQHEGNISRTAPAIGMKRQALQQKIKELGINPSQFRS